MLFCSFFEKPYFLKIKLSSYHIFNCQAFYIFKSWFQRYKVFLYHKCSIFPKISETNKRENATEINIAMSYQLYLFINDWMHTIQKKMLQNCFLLLLICLEIRYYFATSILLQCGNEAITKIKSNKTWNITASQKKQKLFMYFVHFLAPTQFPQK